MIKLGGIILGILLAFGGFFVAKNAKAVDEDVVINEVMVDPSCASDKCEWIEFYNNGKDIVNLKNWTIDDTKKFTNDTLIQPKDFLVVTKNITEFNNVWTVDQSKVVELTSLVLSNSGHTLKIKNPSGSYQENFTWPPSPKTDISWERIDSTISSDSNWHESLIVKGTPAAKNSVTDLVPPQSPSGLSPALGQDFAGESSIIFSWEDSDNQKLFYEFILSKNSSTIVDIFNLTNLNYQVDDLDLGTYSWKVIASNGLDEAESPIYSFTISAPKYCNQIYINELLPDPTGDETTEWIELYNDSDQTVNIKGWWLQDVKGAIHKYTIENDLIIEPFGFAIISRGQSNITLNNDQDGIQLFQPSGNLLYETPIFSDGKGGWTWARGSDGTWSWTTIPTAGYLNKISLPQEDIKEEEIPINTTPIEINTGDYQDYLNKLVKVTGKVTSTSGNTFYLDDGSGEVKIYIQEKTGIDKPEMHKGDIFEVIGIVDLYGRTWRILPQKQEDIQLIEAAVKSTTSTKKVSSAIKSIATAASIGPKKVEATSNSPPSENPRAKTPFWIQMLKAGIALALILFIVLIIKLRQRPKEPTIGGHFGDDET